MLLRSKVRKFSDLQNLLTKTRRSAFAEQNGACRAQPRSIARQQIGQRQLLREMHDVWFDEHRSKQLCNDAPPAYKEIQTIMRAQRDLTAIVSELRPVLAYKQ
ncbi:MAG: RtcB family protein [Planctomycetia bacterium]|nr:RtcB family protein [Planctomycetia bacterium]